MFYKVTYYLTTSGNAVVAKEFNTFQEASAFSLTKPTGSIIEIKLYPDNETKKEDRT